MSILKKAGKFLLIFLKYASLCLGAFIAIFPVISCVIVAFKTDEEFLQTSKMQLPASWLEFSSFTRAWTDGELGRAFSTSFIILVAVLIGSIMIGSMLAYVLNRFRFPGNGIIRNLFLFATLIPGIATQVTVYRIMQNLNLINTLHGYIILMMGTDVIAIYIFLQFFENISKSLDESAIIDGSTYFGVFFRILLPLLKPAIITVMILKGVGTYNEYYMANLYLQDKAKLLTVSTALYRFTGPFGNQYNLICAGVLITLIPALIIFILCQKQIYNGLTQGAVKG